MHISIARVLFYVLAISLAIVFRKKIKTYLANNGCLQSIKLVFAGIYALIGIIFFGCYFYGNHLNHTHPQSIEIYTLILVFSLFLLCIICIGNNTQKNLLVLGSTLGSLFVFITQMHHSNDEGNHFTEAYNVSLGHLLHITKNAVIPKIFLDIPQDMPFKSFIATYQTHIDYNHVIHIPNVIGIAPIGYPTILYIPSAIGLWIGRLFHFTVMNEMFIGRLTNYIAYIAIAYLVIKMLPFGKNIFLLVILSPYLLMLSATFSSDGIGDACVLFFIALCLHYAYEKRPFKWSDYALLGFLAIVILLFKNSAYALSLLFVFLIPLKYTLKNKTLIKYAKVWIPLLVIVLFVVYFIKMYTLPLGLGDTRGPGLNDESLQFKHIVAHPLFTVYAVLMWFKSGLFNPGFMSTIIQGFFFGEGATLVFPMMAVWFYVAATDYNLKTPNLKTELREKSLLLFYIIGTCFVIPIALYIQFSEVGSATIDGVQLRYFFPLFPALLLLMNSKRHHQTIRNYNLKVSFCITVILALSQWYMVLYR